MNKFILLFLVFISLGACSKKLTSSFIKDAATLTELPSTEKFNCNEQLNYTPDAFSEMKYVRVCVHFLDDSTGKCNFSLDEGRKFMGFLINNANKRLGENKKMNLPVGNNTPVLDPGYRYKIVPATDDPNDDGFYKHLDNDLAYFVGKGKNRNNYSKDVIKKYQIKEDSIINIFVLPHHPDSVKSKTYKPLGGGIAIGTSLKMSGLYENDRKPWSYATLLNHEIGHIFGLSHSWIKHDRCDDTPTHPNCWDKNSKPPCDGTHSNNMMDYNNSQMAITPCQLGIVHKGMSKLESRNRKLVIRDWCELDRSKTISISDHVVWNGQRDVKNNIIIQNGASLTIACRLSMPAGSTIRVMPKAQLILNQALVHNDCEQSWKGIELMKQGKSEGQIISYGSTEIRNVD